MEEPEVVATADGVVVSGDPGPSVDPVLMQRSILPSVEPPQKLPVMGVPNEREAKLVSSDYTRFKGDRSKYRSWA